MAVDTKTGHRCSSASQYYEPNKGRANLHVITNARATRVIFKPKSGDEDLVADGLEYVQDGETRAVFAKKEIVICAGMFVALFFCAWSDAFTIGSYQTPQLLELSGMLSTNQRNF